MLTLLVTGAAGLIGGEVCAQAVAAGHRVFALVRRTKEVRGNDGALVPVAGVLAGDVTLPGLGLDCVPEGLDCVIHCAAALEFDAPRDRLDPVNVEGTRNVADFAEKTGARLLHVSTAYVCGTREGTIEEGPVPAGTAFANNYEASKAAAEAVVEASTARWCIARPSIVLGDHETGTIRDFPALCNVFRLMARGAVPVLPVAESARMDLVPVDYVARSLLALAEAGEKSEGKHVHIASTDPLPAAVLPQGVRAFPHFADPIAVEPREFNPATLTASQRRVTERMLQTFGGYLTRAPLFDDARQRALTGLSCPPTDAAWIMRLIEYGITRGYLPQRTSG